MVPTIMYMDDLRTCSSFDTPTQYGTKIVKTSVPRDVSDLYYLALGL